MRVPVLLGALSEELLDIDQPGGLGIRIGLQGHLSIRAALRAMQDTMRALRHGVSPAEIGGLASPGTTDALARAADDRRWTKDYLNG